VVVNLSSRAYGNVAREIQMILPSVDRKDDDG
jgi:hypothetical protein